MGFYLGIFATWLRQAMSLPDDIEIQSDNAAIPRDRKRRPTTRWDPLVKQQSFSMPKVPSRTRHDDTIEEDTATESCPVPSRRRYQTSLSYPPRGGTGRRVGGDGDEDAARPGLGAEQSSLRSPPRHSRSLNSRTEVEQMKMPRLVRQKSSPSLRRGLIDDDKSAGGRRCMNKQNSFSLPNRPYRPHRQGPSHQPKLPVRTRDTDSGSESNNESNSDEISDNLSSMPRLVKQTSFTVARLSSRAPLIGTDEKGANVTQKQQQMAKPDSHTMPRCPIRTFDGDDEVDERTDTLSSMPRLVKQTSFTVARHSSRAPLIGDDEKWGSVIMANSPFSCHKRPIRTFDSEDEPAEKTDTLSSMPRLVKHTSFTIPTLPSGTLQLRDDESDDDSNAQPKADATPESSRHNSSQIHQSKSTSDLQPQSKSTSDLSPQDLSTIHESKSTSDLSPQDLSTSDVDVVIGKKSSSASNSSESPARQHLRLLGESTAVDCTVESAECTYHQREHLYTA
jgi:hypothetical protein